MMKNQIPQEFFNGKIAVCCLNREERELLAKSVDNCDKNWIVSNSGSRPECVWYFRCDSSGRASSATRNISEWGMEYFSMSELFGNSIDYNKFDIDKLMVF